MKNTSLVLLLSLGCAFAVSGFGLFFIGFHGMDSGHNMRYLNTAFDITLLDRASDFQLYSHDELYITGINQMIKGLVFSSVGFMMFGMGLGKIR